MSTPAVAVVTPAFNAAATIADTIGSVLAQTFPDWEMLVVDNGSTDGTLDVAKSFGHPRIRCLRIAHTETPAAPRNRGIEEATAPLVAFLDADDLWVPTFLERQLGVLRETRATLAHCAWMNLCDGRLHVERSHCPAGILEPPELLHRLVQRFLVSCCAVVVERAALIEVGLFDTDPGLRGPEDLDLWLRLAPRSRFVRVPEPLLIVRIRPESVSRNVVGNLAGTILALNKLGRREPELVAGFATDYRRRLAELHFGLGTHKLREGWPGRGLADLLQAARYWPRSVRTWWWLGLALVGPRAARAWGRWRDAGRSAGGPRAGGLSGTG